jgi:eukaryotic-like serine/threonine-protein kinase
MSADFSRENRDRTEEPEDNSVASEPADSWDKGLRLAFSKRSGPPTSATWKAADASATPLPEPGPVPAIKPATEGSLLAEPYKVVGEVGRGGIGVVLQAQDQALGREVAVKVLQPRHLANPAAVARFTREARIAAQLQHPGIVPVYAAGQDELDRPYIAMKLLKGSSLDELLSKRKDLQDRRPQFIRIFEQVCQTMAYAHSRGVIHRDLKPGNVMVGAFGEVQIIDWGFARVLAAAPAEEQRDLELLNAALSPGESSALSVAGAPIGTPAYMAPEQALGDLKALDERTDVFCLGSILCEILTGQPTHASPDVRAVMDAAAKGEIGPAYERLDRSGGDADLVALAKACLKPVKSGRPKDAAAVAERVSAFLAAAEDRVRKAEVQAVEERARASAERRKKWFVAAMAAVVVLAGAGIAWVSWSNVQKRQRVENEAGRILADAAEQARRKEWALAEERVLHAQAVLKGTEADPALRARVEDLLTEYRTNRAEFAAMKDIYELRSHPGTPPPEMDKRYADAFRRLGMDIDVLPAADIGRLVGRRAEDAREKLLLALDDWTMRFKPPQERRGPPGPGRPPEMEREQDPQRRNRILEAAIASDTRPWMNRLRRAILARDREEIDRLKASIDEEARPTMGLILLSHALGRGEEVSDPSLEVLLHAYRLDPGDFWISFFIANGTVLHRGDPRRQELSERHARLALAINPKAAHAYGLLAAALLGRGRPGDREEALALLEKSVELDKGMWGDTVRKILNVHQKGDAGTREEIRRHSEGRRHPPMMQALFDSVR